LEPTGLSEGLGTDNVGTHMHVTWKTPVDECSLRGPVEVNR
jgi:hypothetical protein